MSFGSLTMQTQHVQKYSSQLIHCISNADWIDLKYLAYKQQPQVVVLSQYYCNSQNLLNSHHYG